MKACYFFETLPVHPQPYDLESFCSYTIRLAAANGIEILSRWWLLCYPIGKPRVTDHTGDSPPLSFGLLPELAVCSEETLLRTTFCHLARKFDCAIHPQSIGSFLARSVANHLRYCPECLAERNYYRLTWRFLALLGCPKHGCELRNECGHCAQPIPLLPRLLRAGWCPHCGKDLRRCSSPELDEPSRQKAQARERDLTYLLTPQPYETSVERLKKRLGEQFAYRRLSRQLKVVKVADDLGYSLARLNNIECPSPSYKKGGKFSAYLDYAAYLDVDLQTLFEAPPPEETYEDILAKQVQQVITSLTEAGQWATKDDLVQQTGIDNNAFERYPKLKALWSDFLNQRRQTRYTNLVKQIRQIAAQLEQEGQRVSMSEISRRMGRHPSDMRQYPQTAAAMEQVAGPAAQARYEAQREEQLLQLVQDAIADLEARDERVSKTAICREVGVSQETLERRPRIRTFLAELIPVKAQEYLTRQRQQREAGWLLRVQQGVETLRAGGHPITISVICQIVNKSENGLRSYPSVDTFMKQAVQEYLAQQRQQREADLLLLVQQGAETVRATGQPVTVRAICQTIGKAENGLRTYPIIDAFLKQVVASNMRSRLVSEG
jgi:transcriptional regulator with XRE-family HTH domain